MTAYGGFTGRSDGATGREVGSSVSLSESSFSATGKVEAHFIMVS